MDIEKMKGYHLRWFGQTVWQTLTSYCEREKPGEEKKHTKKKNSQFE